MTDEADRVARGLTGAQRRAVLALPATGGYIWRHDIRKPTADALSNLGVFGPSDHYGRRFTPFGLLVRDKLKGMEDG